MRTLSPLVILAGATFACGSRSSDSAGDAGPADSAPDNDGGASCDVPDADFDGHGSLRCGGDDCDDRDPGTHPGAADEWSIDTLLTLPPKCAGCSASPVRCVSLALDAEGFIHLAYARYHPEEVPHSLIREGTWSGAGWTFADVDPSRERLVRTDCDLVFGGDGVGHILFDGEDGPYDWDTWDAIMQAYDSAPEDPDNDWTVQATSLPFQPFAATADSAGILHVVSRSYNELQYFADASGSFDLVSAISTDADWGLLMPSIAIAPDGAVHTAFTMSDASVVHAVNQGGLWQFDAVTSDGGWPFVRVDASGGAHLLYEGGVSDEYARTEATYWNVERLRDSSVMHRLFLDTDGSAHACYRQVPEQMYSYASNTTGAWTYRPLSESSGFDGTGGCDVAVDATGEVHVVFADDDGAVLRHAHGSRADGIDENCDGQLW
jgi:hypothetical protein